jgi:hypothetical protein
LRSPQANLITQNTQPVFWWTSVIGGQAYEIMFATDIGFANIVDAKVIVGSLSYVPTTAFGDGTYYWHVRARDISNQPGKWSPSRSFTVDTSGPSAPALSSPANGISSSRTPTFTWFIVPAAVSYEFQYDNDPNFTNPDYTASVRGSFRRPPAMPKGIYYWRVRAKDSAGNWGAWSSSFTINLVTP